jgi:hypothetical protein
VTSAAEYVSPIETAVKPLKDDAIDRANKYAAELLSKMASELEAAGNDLQVCAPYPESFGCTRKTYMAGQSKYKLFRSVTRPRAATRKPNEPDFADMSKGAVDRFLETAKVNAAAQYDAFVLKLIAKIGPAVSATLTGNHVWGYSILAVELPDGSRQNWKTQQIINVSKLGMLFNQWPTRKVR